MHTIKTLLITNSRLPLKKCSFYDVLIGRRYMKERGFVSQTNLHHYPLCQRSIAGNYFFEDCAK